MTPRQASLMADIFSGAVAISVAIALAGLTWRLVLLASHRPVQVGAGPPVMRSFAVDVGPIVTLAPFGNAVGGPLQATSLPLELRGILLAVPAEASSALISASGGPVLSYKAGQTLPAGATIETIAMDRVILSVGGHRELLTFPKPAGVAATPGSTFAQPGISSGTPMAPPTSPLLTAPATSAVTPLANLIDSLGATPVDGGYRVGDTASPVVRQAGLLPGDVIRQVNGTMLGNPAMDRQVFASAARSGSVRVDLVRNDRRLTITVPLH